MAKSQIDIHFGRLLKRLSSIFQPNVKKLLRIVIDKVKNILRLSHIYLYSGAAFFFAIKI